MIYTEKVREHLIAANRGEAEGSDPDGRYLMAAVRLPLGTDLGNFNLYPPCFIGHEGEHEECPVCWASDIVTVETSLAFFGFLGMSEEHLENLKVEW